MTNQDENFQIILAKEDYDKLAKWEQLYKSHQNQQTKNVQQIKKLRQLTTKQKKTIYQRVQQIKFLQNLINSHIQRIFKRQIPSVIDINMSYYQQIADLQAQGLNSIQQKELIQKFEFNHSQLIKKLQNEQKKFLSAEAQLIKVQQLYQAEKNNKSVQVVYSQVRKNKLDEQIIKDLMKEKNILQNRVKNLEIDLALKVQQNVSLQKEIQAHKNKIVSSGEKSYQIKLLIDQYYKQLEVSLQTIGSLNRKQIQIVVLNEFNGIIQYVNSLMKKTFVTEAINKKIK